MVGNSKSVRLVACLLKHLKGFGALIEVKRHAVVGKVQFFKSFGDANEGYPPAESELVKNLYGRRELALASVDEHQLGQRQSLVEYPGIAPGQGLLHGGKIVGAFYRFDVKMPVFRLGWLSVDEDHTGRHGVGSLSVGVVKALDAARLTRKPQVLLHLPHYAVAVAFGVNKLDVF